MMPAMTTTTTRLPPKLRIAERAVAVDAGRLVAWVAHVGRLEGLTRLESAFALFLASLPSCRRKRCRENSRDLF
jgi:hypothetical protein